MRSQYHQYKQETYTTADHYPCYSDYETCRVAVAGPPTMIFIKQNIQFSEFKSQPTWEAKNKRHNLKIKQN